MDGVAIFQEFVQVVTVSDHVSATNGRGKLDEDAAGRIVIDAGNVNAGSAICSGGCDCVS